MKVKSDGRASGADRQRWLRGPSNSSVEKKVSAAALTLLYCQAVDAAPAVARVALPPRSVCEDFSDDVALEATKYLGLSEALLGASCDVGSCPWVAAHSHERDHPEGPVRIAVTTSV